MSRNQWWEQRQHEQKLDRSRARGKKNANQQTQLDPRRRCVKCAGVGRVRSTVRGEGNEGFSEICRSCGGGGFEISERAAVAPIDVANLSNTDIAYLVQLTGVDCVRLHGSPERELRKTAQRVHAKLKEIECDRYNRGAKRP